MTSTRHILAVMAFAAATLVAHAASTTISQKGRLFSMDSLAIKKGDTVVFNNDDTVPHNVVSKSPGNEFDLGYQPPGASTPVTFDGLGDVNVICTIHPRMKVTIHVAN